MKFLIDAQLPKSLKKVFLKQGHNCIHTLDLELGNNTPNKIINKISIEEERILITKDSDFFQSFFIKNEPFKLIFVRLGNTSKDELIRFLKTILVRLFPTLKKKMSF